MPVWKHELLYAKKGGRYRVICRCGWQTRWFDNNEDVLRLGQAHTGLREKTPPVR